MRNVISVIAILASIIAIGYSASVQKFYKEYVRTSEELLWELEEICEQHDIPWGDTICEGYTWEEYTDARNNLGLGELEYYGNVKGL